MRNLCNKVLDTVNEYKKTGDLKLSFQYVEGYKKARFIFIGEIDVIQRILNSIKGR